MFEKYLNPGKRHPFSPLDEDPFLRSSSERRPVKPLKNSGDPGQEEFLTRKEKADLWSGIPKGWTLML